MIPSYQPLEYPPTEALWLRLEQHLQQLPSPILEGLIQADKWTSGILVNRRGDRCLIGQVQKIQQGLEVFYFLEDPIATSYTYDRLCNRLSMHQVVPVIKTHCQKILEARNGG